MQVSVKEISSRLADRADSVASMLLPGGKLMKGEWVAGDVRGGEGSSLKVHLSGNHAGEWRDWANDDHHGDLLDLWRFAKDITLPDAVREAKSYLGIVEDVFTPNVKTYKAPPADVTKSITPEGKAMSFLIDTRKIRRDTIERFKIEIAPDSRAIAFPCYSPSGQLINRSYRTVPQNGEKKKVWQDAGCAPSLFGWHALDPVAFEKRTVLLAEGQIDAMTWTQWGVPALSIPNGSGGQWIEYEWDNLAAFDHIYLSFDMDGAGGEIVRKAIQRLGTHRCMVVQIPKKDANDCLLAGHTAADAQAWVAAAKAPSIKGLTLARDLRARVAEELREKREPFTLPFFRVEWPHAGFYPHPGDVTVWTGPTGHGKSTFLNFMILGLISKGEHVFIASMEVKPERNIRKMATALCGGQLNEQLMDGFLNDAGDLLVFADVVGYIEQKHLLEMMWFSFRRYGCSRFIIDSLMRIKGLEEDYPAQGDFMNQLQEFSKTTGAFVDLVCHPRKMTNGQRPSELDVKGSSLIPNNADNVVSIIKNLEKDKLRKENALTPHQNSIMHDAEVRIEKQREVGWTGLFKLGFDHRFFRYRLMN